MWLAHFAVLIFINGFVSLGKIVHVLLRCLLIFNSVAGYGAPVFENDIDKSLCNLIRTLVLSILIMIK